MVIIEGKDLLDQPIIEFAHPFAGQEIDNCIAALQEFGSVAP